MILTVVVILILAVLTYFNVRATLAHLRMAKTMVEMDEQLVALRKQMKAILRDASRALSDATRILDKQYRQQKDVDDILYHAARARERDS